MKLKESAIIAEAGVDYPRMQASPIYTHFKNTIAAALREYDPRNLHTAEEKLAFWINLYNLLTIDAVVQFAVRRSVTEGCFGMIRFFRRASYNVGGMRFSLEDIEHGILRANRGVSYFPGSHFSCQDPRYRLTLREIDPRIHFALNCASKSCPPIAFYTPERIHAQLDLAAANFIDGETHLHSSGVALIISRIFKWYQKDFGGRAGVLDFIARYLPKQDIRRQLIENFDYRTIAEYANYDWYLNSLA